MNILLDTQLSKEKAASYTKEEIKSLGTQTFVSELFNTMIDSQGIGIAAPQVGVLKRAICVHVDGFSEIMFNPAVLKRRGKIDMTEGCLSFPGVFKNLIRSETISVKWLDRSGKVCYKELSGLAARVVLHEIDHLNGVTFVSDRS